MGEGVELRYETNFSTEAVLVPMPNLEGAGGGRSF